MPLVDPEKKREYNKRQREKKKQQEEMLISNQEAIISNQEAQEEVLPSNQEELKPSDTSSIPDTETITLDKEAYDFLINHYRDSIQKQSEKTEEKEEKPKPENETESFFFQIVKHSKTAIATTLPLLALKLVVSGIQSSLSCPVTDTQNTHNHSSSESTTGPAPRVFNLEC